MKLDNKKTSNTAPESYQVRPALLKTLKKSEKRKRCHPKSVDKQRISQPKTQ